MNTNRVLFLVVIMLVIALSSNVIGEEGDEGINDTNSTINDTVDINETTELNDSDDNGVYADIDDVPDDNVPPINDTVELNETTEINETAELNETNETIETDDDYLYEDVENSPDDADELIPAEDFGEYVEEVVEKVEEGTKLSEHSTIALVISAPDEIMPGSVSSFTVYVWNFGELEVNDIPVKAVVPNALELLDNDIVVIDSIEAMSSEILNFDFRTKVYGTYEVQVEYLDIVSKEKIEVRPPHSPLLSIDISTPPIWPVDSTWDVYVDVYNGGNETALNTIVELALSPDLSTTDPLIKSAGDLGTTLPDSHVQLVWPVHVDYAGTPTVTANATCDNCIPDSETQEGNSTTTVELNFTSIIMPDTLTVGNTYQATGVIENSGSGNATNVSVSIQVPTQLEVIGADVQYVDITFGETKNVVFDVNAISSGDSLSLSIRTQHLETSYDKTLTKQFDTTSVDTEAPSFISIIANPDPASLGLVVIEFTASEALLSNPAVTVNSNAAVYDSNIGNDYVYNYTVTLSDTEGVATIDVSGDDLAGNPGSSSGTFVIDYTGVTVDRVEADSYLVVPGTDVIITAVEASGDDSLTGAVTITRLSDMVDVVDNGVMVNSGSGNYSYTWSTTGYLGNEFNVTASLTDGASTDYGNVTVVLDTPPSIVQALPSINYTSNTVYTLDLDNYFEDVDPLDDLVYSYSVDENNITVSITDNIAELSNLLDFIGIGYVTFIASDNYFSVNQTAFVNVTAQADLYIDSIVFSPVSPKENEETNITVYVNNSGPPDTADFNLSLFIDSVYFDSAVINVATRDTTSVLFVKSDWNNAMGEHNITAIADYLDEIDETDETNNELTSVINVQQWQVYYGQTPEELVLSDASGNNMNSWTVTSNGNVYAVDPSVSIDWNNIFAVSDFAAADAALGLSGSESVSTLYSGAATETFSVYGNNVLNVPVINSIDNPNFKTGIMKDSSNNYIFAAKINLNSNGAYGNYDYEVRVPASLRDVNGNVSLRYEVK